MRIILDTLTILLILAMGSVALEIKEYYKEETERARAETIYWTDTGIICPLWDAYEVNR